MKDEKRKELMQKMRHEGLTYSEIANIVGLSPNTVKSIFMRDKNNAADTSGSKAALLCKYCGKALKHHPGKKKKHFCNNKCRTD